MKDKFVIIFITCLTIGLFALPLLIELSYAFEDASLNPNDYARITDVDYKAVVVDEPESDGKVVITERLTFDVHAASRSNLFWELWRDLPEDYVDGVKVDYKVNSVKQILEDGTEVIYEESPRLYWEDEDYVSTNSRYGPGKWYHSEGPYDEYSAQYECVFFYVDGLYREEVVFEIEYEMYNAALRYNDCSDLYISLYSGDTIKYLESFSAEILFPDELMPREGNYDVFTYGTKANDFPVSESDTRNPGYHTFYFDLDEEELQFRPYNEYIEFDLVSYGADKHSFTEYASWNDYSSYDVLDEIYDEQRAYALKPQLFEALKGFVLLFSLGGSALLTLYVHSTKSRMKSKYTFYTPEVEYEYFRDVPCTLDPNFAAALVFCKHKQKKDDSGIYSAILLSLARKKYIYLREEGLSDVKIFILAPTLEEREPLTPSEEQYFNLLVRHAVDNTILMSTLQQRVSSDYENTNAFARNIKNTIVNIGIPGGYFQKADYMQPKRQLRSLSNFLMTFGIIFITLINLISYQTRLDFAFGSFFIWGIVCVGNSIYLKILSKRYVLLTQLGENEYAKWRGLYNFLNSETLISERSIIELPLWEKYLVYATAFGLSEKVIKAISLCCPEAGSSYVLNNTCYRSRSFHVSSRSFRTAVHTGSSYSGGGGGFGYGGGGRGGGGGGGGH